MTPNDLIHDRQLTNYLLGLSPEDEAERLDEASIADDETASRLTEVENDLVDAYVAGRLDSGTREQFEAFYLRSPRRREKVKFAKRFLTVVERAANAPAIAVAGTSNGSSRVRQFAPRLDAPKPVMRQRRISWPLTAVASLALCCGVVVNDLQLRQGLTRARQQGAAQDRRAESLTRQLDEARNETVQITDALERAQAAASPRDRSTIGGALAALGASARVLSQAVVLFPQTRSIGQPPTAGVAAGAVSVRFELRLESNEFAVYRAVLKDPDSNRVVWRSGDLSPRSGGSSFVPVSVPSAVLTSQHYSFELAGIDSTGSETTVGSYGVQVDRHQREDPSPPHRP